MDLNFLDQSPEITPLLVSLYDQQKLYALADDNKPEARNALTNGIVDILDKDLTAREADLVADILVELIRQAEKDLRQAVAGRIAAMDNVPLRLALQIAHDEIDVAAPVLKSCPVLGSHDLLYIIKSKSAAHWRAVAARKILADEVINTLADTKDLNTAITLAENRNITLTDHALSGLATLARNQDRLAQPLIQRDEITDDLIQAIYKHAGETVKNAIRDLYPALADTVSDSVDEITEDITETATKPPLHKMMPDSGHMQRAEQYAARGLLTIGFILETLKRGEVRSFVAQLSRYTGMAPATIIEILEQPSGQGLALLCKALDILKPDFISMFLLSRKMQGIKKAMDVKEMSTAVEYFTRADPELARKILEDSIKKDPHP